MGQRSDASHGRPRRKPFLCICFGVHLLWGNTGAATSTDIMGQRSDASHGRPRHKPFLGICLGETQAPQRPQTLRHHQLPKWRTLLLLMSFGMMVCYCQRFGLPTTGGNALTLTDSKCALLEKSADTCKPACIHSYIHWSCMFGAHRRLPATGGKPQTSTSVCRCIGAKGYISMCVYVGLHVYRLL